MAKADEQAAAPVDRVQTLMDNAVQIEEERAAITERRTANRTALRNLYDAGILTDEEKAWVDEVYPYTPRERKSDTEPDAEPDNAEPNAAAAQRNPVRGTGEAVTR